MKKKWSGERLETFVHGEFVSEHLHRYCISTLFSKDKVVLDIASGEGYGSNLLAEISKQVIGVDIDDKAITAAQIKYKKVNLSFKLGSADNIPVDSNSIDVLISFETIEHHDKHLEMFSEIKRVLKPNGILIMSSPDKKYHSDVQNKKNPFHIKELYLEEFEELVKNNFLNYDVYFQRFINNASLIASTHEFKELNIFSGDFDSIYSRKLDPLYNLIIASNSNLEKLKLSVFDGEILTKRMNEAKIKSIQSSTTFRIGKLISYPFFKAKKFFKK